MGGAEQTESSERTRRRIDRHVVAAHRLRGIAAPLLPLLGVLVGWSEEPLGLVSAAVVGIGAMVALLATNSWTVRGPAPVAEVIVDSAVSLIVCALVAGDALAAAWLIALIPALEAMVRLRRRSALVVIGVLGAGLVLIQLVLPSAVAGSTFTSLTITFVAIGVVVRVCLAVVDEIRIERRLGAVLRREGRRRGDLLQALGGAVRRMDEADPLHAVAAMSIEVGAQHAYVVVDGEVVDRIVERSSSSGSFVTDATLVAVAGVGRIRFAAGLTGPHGVDADEVGEAVAARLGSAELVVLPIDDRAAVISLAAVLPGPLVANALEIAARHAAASRRLPVV